MTSDPTTSCTTSHYCIFSLHQLCLSSGQQASSDKQHRPVTVSGHRQKISQCTDPTHACSAAACRFRHPTENAGAGCPAGSSLVPRDDATDHMEKTACPARGVRTSLASHNLAPVLESSSPHGCDPPPNCTSNGSRASNPPAPNEGRNQGSAASSWCAALADCSTSSRASLSGCCWCWRSRGLSSRSWALGAPGEAWTTPCGRPSTCAPGTDGGASTAAGGCSTPALCDCTLNSAMRSGNLYASCCSCPTSACKQ
jgi:hypothetical protein